MEYGLIGERLNYSFSKTIHEKLADYAYELHPLSREEFPSFMEKRDFRGINVTIPYKRDVIPYLSVLSDSARSIGAVNTIVNREGKLSGYNTDYSGFLFLLRHHGIDPAGRKVLILGTGGASAAVSAVCRDLQAKELLLVSRTGKGGAVTYEEAAASHRDAELIINTTPVGTFPDLQSSPLDLTPFTACQAVADVIYNPEETALIRQAKALGMQGVTGLSMLVAQAKYACELFLDRKISDEVIPTLTEEIARDLYH